MRLDEAVSVWAGDIPALAVYLGDTIVWEPAPTSPVIREVVESPDSQTNTHVITTSSAPRNGDTLLLIHASDNDAPTAPTTDAGTFTEFGTRMQDGNTTGSLQIFTCPITSDGAINVTIPNSSGYDIFGCAIVFEGSVEPEAEARKTYPSANIAFTTADVVTLGDDRMILHTAFTKGLGSGTLSWPTLDEITYVKAPPFSAITAATVDQPVEGLAVTHDIDWDSTNIKPCIRSISIKSL